MQRAIDLERHKIRSEAVRQAERLAATHDPSGKSFNVGEVVVLPDGQVRSKESIAKAEETRVRKAQQDKEAREAEEAYKLRQKEMKEQRKSFLEARKSEGTDENMAIRLWEAEQRKILAENPIKNPDQARFIEVVNRQGLVQIQKISKKQLQRREQLQPKPVPPRPVIPEGIMLPEGEVNLIELWDITDQQITARLREQKKAKSQAGKDLRAVQKEQKKFNRAMKVLKKQAANAGVPWDPEKAKRVVLGLEPGLVTQSDEEEANAHSGSDFDSDSNSDSDSSSGEDVDGESTRKKSKKNKRSDSTSANDSASQPTDPTKKKKKLPNPPRPRLNLTLLEKSAELERQRAEKKRAARLQRRAERKQAAAKQAQEIEEQLAKQKLEESTKRTEVVEGDVLKEASKKRKRSEERGKEEG